MSLKILLSSSLRKFVPGYDPEKGVELSIEENTPVSEVCEKLRIPAKEIKIIMVDGRGRSPDYRLSGNERVGLFPPVGGG